MKLVSTRGLARPVKRLLVWLEGWGLRLLIGFTALTGAVLVWQSLIACEGLQGCVGAVYKTVTGDKAEQSLAEKLFSAMLTLAIGWAAVEVYVASLGLKFDAWLAPRICEAHLVILAGRSAGRTAAQDVTRRKNDLRSNAALAVEVAKAEASSGKWDVVLYLPGIDSKTRRELWRRGVLVLQDELHPSDLLATAGAGRARKLVAMRDDPDENVVLVSTALSRTTNPRPQHVEVPESQSSGAENLQCLMMIGTTDPGRSFSADQRHRVRYFNEAELIARELLRAHPPDLQVATASEKRVHVLLVGLGSVGKALVLRMSHMACYRSGLNARVTIVDEPGARNWKELDSAHPRLKDVLQIRLVETAITGLTDDMLATLQEGVPLTMVYICTKDEVFNLQCARILVEELDKVNIDAGDSPAHPAPIVLLDPPGGCVLVGLKQEPNYQPRIGLFSLVSPEAGIAQAEAISPIRSVLEGLDDCVAEVLHEAYRSSELGKENPDPGSWRVIPERDRISNRWAADHFDVKLRALSAQLQDWDEEGAAERIDPKELELIAGMEHHRWVAEKVMSGSQLGFKEGKDRPTLVPTAYLTKVEFDKDKAQIQTLYNFYRDQRKMQVVFPKDSATATENTSKVSDCSAVAAYLLQSIQSKKADDQVVPRHFLLHGSGTLAEQTMHLLAHYASKRDSRPLRITWVGKDAPARASDLTGPFGPQVLDLRPFDRPAEDPNAGIDADPGRALDSELPLNAILLCPDPEERLPGIVDSLAECLRKTRNSGVDTRIKVLAVAWGPTPTCEVRNGYLGAAELVWINARELLAGQSPEAPRSPKGGRSHSASAQSNVVAHTSPPRARSEKSGGEPGQA